MRASESKLQKFDFQDSEIASLKFMISCLRSLIEILSQVKPSELSDQTVCLDPNFAFTLKCSLHVV